MQSAEEWLHAAAHIVSFGIEVIAVLVIAMGALDAVRRGLWAIWRRARMEAERAVWVRFSRWLIAGLTFQLASDMVRTAVAPTWDDIGRLAAIAALRAGLSLALELEAKNVERSAPAAFRRAPTPSGPPDRPVQSSRHSS